MEEIKKRDCYETPQYLADWAVGYGHQAVVQARAAEVLRTMEHCESLLIGNLTKALAEPYRMLEPGCGETVPFGRAALNLGYEVDAVEKRALEYPEIEESLTIFCDDFVRDVDLRVIPFDLIATNPPFSQAESFIRRSLELLKPYGVAVFLLRLEFLSSLKRRALYRDRPPAEVHVLQRRPSFSKDGKTDAQEYAFYVWMGDAVTTIATTLYWLDNKSLYEASRSNSGSKV